MNSNKKFAFLFPGQGAQYLGMGKDFHETYPLVKETFEEAEDILKRKIYDIILHGPENLLVETHNSQIAIFILSTAITKVLNKLFPEIQPHVCAGLSLGEYSAIFACRMLSFAECLQLVDKRAKFMSELCQKQQGQMAVVLGLASSQVEEMIREANVPNDLWAANFNCPGQIVISGTKKGIEKAIILAKKYGAKRVLPLAVHGAFHSGLMQEAEERLTPYINDITLQKGEAQLVMNYTGKIATDFNEIKTNLILQITHSVLWEQSINEIENHGMDFYLEIGCGKSLTGFNKRIGVKAPTISIEKISDLQALEKL